MSCVWAGGAIPGSGLPCNLRRRLAASVGAGDLSPEEAQAVAGVLEVQRKALETAELERRIAALEQRQETKRRAVG